MTKHLTILRKGLILISVPLFFQLVFIALVANVRHESSMAEWWTIHTKESIALAQRCRVLLLSANEAIQGYGITRDRSFEDALSRSSARVTSEIARLKEHVSDNPPQVRAVSKIQEDVSAFLTYTSESHDIVRDRRLNAASAASRRRRSQVLIDALEARFDEFLEVEQALDKTRHERLDSSWASFDRILWGGIGASVFFTVLLAVVFSRSISGRIANLTDNAIRLAEGKELTPPIAGGDEIARLDHVFHDMAAILAEAARRERVHSELLERRAEELASVNEQLRQKAQENEMFVYSVSHDLRSPLVNLQGFSKELGLIGMDLTRLVDRDDVPSAVRGQARTMIESEMVESIGFIQTAVTRLSSIIDALLRLSRAGRVEYRRQRVDVAATVRRVVGALRGTIDQRGAKVEVDDLPPAWGDPTAIEQVFANLIGNAINYLDRDRPGKIEVYSPDLGEVAEGVASDSVVFAVRDNGLGIADSYKNKIFTAFQRLHGDVAKGEGIGLALVRRMVERHGGRVWFESEAGRGTTFFAAFPVAGEKSGDGDGESSGEASAIKNGRDAAWQPSR